MKAETKTRFVRGRQEWDDRYSDLARGKRNWQLAALGLLALDLILGSALGWLATESRITPYVVEVDRIGQAVAFGPAEQLRSTDERLERYLLSLYLYNLRTIHGDSEAQRAILTRAYDYTRGSAVAFLNRHFQRRNPFEIARGERVRVEVHSILPLSKTSWQVQWSEVALTQAGQEGGRTNWQAVLTVELDPPETTEELLKNPLGLYVTEISWTQTF